MPPGLRKLALTTHVVTSVGWLGSVTVFLVLAVVGLTSQDTQRVRGAYLAMETTGWYVIVPLAFASLLTGIVQSMGTTWGLLRHYWVLMKLVLTVVATFLLLLHMQVADLVADVAARTVLSGGDLSGMRIQLVLDAAAAVAVLLTTTSLSIYKPRGITRYGWRVQQQRADRPGGAAMDTGAPAQA
ncbi:hypothetical protein ABZ214_33535 [Streptomyces iakyrus]|uniref:hypothetical protein n=1 Tax=Streptomyces iakyrus TaxID=68219 RepID=UPI0033BA9AF1